MQQAASGLAAVLGGMMLGQGEGGEMTGFPLVGGLACVAALLRVWLAGHLRPAVGGEDATVSLDGAIPHPVPAVRMDPARMERGYRKLRLRCVPRTGASLSGRRQPPSRGAQGACARRSDIRIIFGGPLRADGPPPRRHRERPRRAHRPRHRG